MDVDRALTQNGVVGCRQLYASGTTCSAIKAAVGAGRLFRMFHGTYAIADPTLLPLAWETAALLSLGPDSFLSHRSAAAIWGLAIPSPTIVDVTLVGRSARSRDRMRIHRVKTLHPADVTTKSNLRLTSPARALIEFAGQATSSELEHAFGEARAKQRINEYKLNDALERLPQNDPGAALVRRLLHADPGSTYTRSRTERRMRKLMKQANLPQPRVNVPLLGFTADFLWEEHKLILEVDAYGTHGDRIAFERDRRRDQVHIAAGYTVIRVTWQQLESEPYAVIARIAQALALRAA
jgi:very-short-patch-repair endonuclease